MTTGHVKGRIYKLDLALITKLSIYQYYCIISVLKDGTIPISRCPGFLKDMSAVEA